MKAGKKKKNGFWFCRPKGRPQPRAGCLTNTPYCLNDKYTLPLNDKCTLLFIDKYTLPLNDKCTLLLSDKYTLLLNDKWPLLFKIKLNSAPPPPKKGRRKIVFRLCWLRNILSVLTVDWHCWVHVGSPNTWHTATCVDVWHSWPHSRSMVVCHSRLQTPQPPLFLSFFFIFLPLR